MNTLAQTNVSTKPWWRHGMVWLVISGPLVVVVAGLFTAYVAIRGADVVLNESDAQTPAMKARNHAATPDKDVPQQQPTKP